MIVDYLFADIEIGCLSSVRPSSVALLQVSFSLQFADSSFDCGNATLGVGCYPPVSGIAAFILSLTIAQVSINALSSKG